MSRRRTHLRKNRHTSRTLLSIKILVAHGDGSNACGDHMPVQEGDLGQDDRSLGMPQVEHEEGKFDFDKPQCS